MSITKDTDLSEFFKEASEDHDKLANIFCALLNKETQSADILVRVMANTVLRDPELLLHIVSNKSIIKCLQISCTVAFEAGRLYGRSELIKELESK